MDELIVLICGSNELTYSPELVARLLILYFGIVCISSLISAVFKGAKI